ncbi:hypothetical protein NTE_01504 [Candidatus Nitrososphaera evergladensis SR1]|uniref:Uncharacterized protein n=1 Tax=Candidatus Nitrososphaera evergladensis SR1 TaxID=1459636 RepID=A0A075MRX3_9ARCH|nr:hypothetical protein [Candidatus Nitrososphaera evergladensis]AIF83567.1 hypothetical protein NTE_01504 [Candidatus Nitrososphaera evergladensis SR1]
MLLKKAKAINKPSYNRMQRERKEMKAKLVALGGGIIAAGVLLFLYVSLQPTTPDCLDNCGLTSGGDLYLTSMLPIVIFTLGGWMLALGIRRK